MCGGGHPESLAYTVLLNKALGNPAPTQISTAVMQMLDAKAVTEGDQIYFKSVSLVQWGDLATTAAGLRAILAVNPVDSRITSVLRWIMLQRNGQYWSSTRDTAAVLTALADYLSTQPAGLPGGQVNILLNGQPLRSVVFEGETLRKGEMTVQIPDVNLQSGKNEITLAANERDRRNVLLHAASADRGHGRNGGGAAPRTQHQPGVPEYRPAQTERRKIYAGGRAYQQHPPESGADSRAPHHRMPARSRLCPY